MTGRQPLRPATFERAAGGAVDGGTLDTRGGPAPRLIGSDIGCGMRPLVFDGDAEAIAGRDAQLEARLQPCVLRRRPRPGAERARGGRCSATACTGCLEATPDKTGRG